ncbi:helix-turn-helix domain-containing protein [Permianibacter aggregans]|uniref:AraC family transcriptional regulator n=1 Tax=Permianibacter aggregans TaxID=1510150 RepID=A0A4R6UTR0_9GAMM|nr:AraC family transcriptional regulator [Permianibacter aggregans]QGX38405.1 AraC family transcriptional regulator [Permianibacter aggregans]TDQ48735.1 AraC family transcriptional regulator [Permianibacter aggregans]
MHYQEYAPPDDLSRHIRCIWWLRESDPAGHPTAIYPDGCCELVVHRGMPFSAFSRQNGWHPQGRLLFVAQQREAVRLKSVGAVDCIGVRLQPVASACIAGERLPALRDQVCDLEALSAACAEALVKASESLQASDEPEPLWRMLRHWVLPHAIDSRIELAVKTLEAEQGRARIEAVAELVGMSLRAFQVRFLTEVGLSAKEFARVLRLQSVIRLLDNENLPLTEASLASGFSDQAHATRELRRMIGLTPARLFAALRNDRGGDETVRLAAAFVRGRS